MKDIKNTIPRAHVGSPALAQARQSDNALPIAKNPLPLDDAANTTSNHPSAIALHLSRKKKRRYMKRETIPAQLEHSERESRVNSHQSSTKPASDECLNNPIQSRKEGKKALQQQKKAVIKLENSDTVATDSHQSSTEPTFENEIDNEPLQSRNQEKKALRRQKNAANKLAKSLPKAKNPDLSEALPNPGESSPDRLHPGALSIPPSPSMGPRQLYPLLVCSLGNPGKQYANTLHSAGHYLLDIIRAKGYYTPFSKGWGGTMCTPSMVRAKYHVLWGSTQQKVTELQPDEDNFTLWQSTKLMNVSGPSVKSAWQTFSTQQKAQGREPRLVIVHDELEAPLGAVSIKASTISAKGHNGVKSCQASLPNLKYWRVAIGIGRPESRAPDVVSKYVLRKMTLREERAIEDAAHTALRTLRLIAEGNV
ncbi:peptidyl-tRNA hydrolase-domain-containing protein [Dendryphion nanum]|uniref:peptidyl-tRNA hydrolase n=1 Tax=Dendryphion nanum TaxID=256645 RepID=A0A9P9DP53_9PLEO|nr:peptidyl-tRNA hydrolase-domain-containing protein [Dendryphion nanum]